MEFDPVVAWVEVVQACNRRDWAVVDAAISGAYDHVVVVGGVYDSTPAYREGKAGTLATIRKMADLRGWTQRLHSVVTVDHHTAIAVFDDCFSDGTVRPGCALLRFNADGQLIQAYHPSVPHEDGAPSGRSSRAPGSHTPR